MDQHLKSCNQDLWTIAKKPRRARERVQARDNLAFKLWSLEQILVFGNQRSRPKIEQ